MEKIIFGGAMLSAFLVFGLFVFMHLPI